MTTAEPAALPDRVRWQAFGVSVSVAALTILDLSKVNVGLPSIEASLNAGPTELQTVVAGYALAFGLSLVPSGRLGDLKSRRIMFIIGLIAFTVTSLLCALAPNAPLLIVGRFLQGIAAGIQMPQVLGLTQQLFQGKERGQAFGLFGAIIGLSTAFGPTIGGLLIAIGGDQDGWRLLFWMNVPLGIILLIAAIKLLPKKQKHESKVMDLDPVGLLLLGVTIIAFMLPFVLTTGAPGDDPNRWWLLALAVVSGTGFVLWERRYARRGRSPVVKFSLFSLASYRNGLLIATVYFAAIPSIFLLTTLYLQQGLDLEPVFAGMVTIPFALASAVTAWIGGRLVDRLGRTLVVIGLAVVLVGITIVMILAVVTPAEASPWAMAAALTVAGAGAGFVISPNQTLTLQEIPVTEGGVAGSMAQLGQRVGTAMGLAAATSLFFSTLYAEGDRADQLGVYHDSYRNGVLVALVLIAAALALGLLDMRSRRKASIA